MFSRRSPSIRVAALTLDQVRSLPPMPSGYETDRVYRLEKRARKDAVEWALKGVRLEHPFRKRYDDGVSGEWLESYADAGSPESLRFLGATQDENVLGVATWTVSEWNASVWLVDIRVRADYRGTGVGTALVHALRERCGKEGLRGIFVETQICNYPAMRFYRRCGFEISGFNDHLYTNADLVDQDVAVFLYLEV